MLNERTVKGVLLKFIAFNAILSAIVRPSVKISLLPCLKSKYLFPKTFGIVCSIIVFVILMMLEWCWLALITMDPGCLAKQIEKYGCSAINQFPCCNKCNLPKPPRCHHCSKCGCCILYMDHHCKSLGVCLAYRNFKTFMLTLFYGAAACGFGSFILFACVFFDIGQRKLTQLAISLILMLFSGSVSFFADHYLKLKRNNLTTIEKMFDTNEIVEELPNARVFEDNFRKFFPLPSTFNPFTPFDNLI